MPAAFANPLAGMPAWVQSLPAPISKYWMEAQRPLASLIFVAPLLAIYEYGVVTFPQAARNGADVWMRSWLQTLGLGGYFLLPLLTIGVLIAWHHVSQSPWRLRRGVLLGMAIESIAFGALLLLAVQVAQQFAPVPPPMPTGFRPLAVPAVVQEMPAADQTRLWMAAPAAERLLGRVVQYVGAGIYEEVLFRLLLIPATLALLAGLVVNRSRRVIAAIALSSLLFAAAHHVGAHGDGFTMPLFAFRAAAGGFFAWLFLARGFGIAIGAHAAYDLLVVLLAT